MTYLERLLYGLYSQPLYLVVLVLALLVLGSLLVIWRLASFLYKGQRELIACQRETVQSHEVTIRGLIEEMAQQLTAIAKQINVQEELVISLPDVRRILDGTLKVQDGQLVSVISANRTSE